MTKDKLDEIFYLQDKFNTDLIRRRDLDNYTVDEWLQKQILATFSELSELLDETNFKWWKNPKNLDMENVKGELVDILHFFVSMCLKTGMTSEELYERYILKNKENFDRQNGLSDKKGYES